MKNNAKRLAALLMILVLLFSVSTTAFASTVYSNVITVHATEKPEETTAPEETEAPVEPEVTEEPEATEEPEVTEDPEATEEPEVTEDPEATEEPEVTEDPEATVEPEATEEPAEEVGPTAEELLANVEVFVECEIISVGDAPAFGDTIQLTAVVTGAEDLEYDIVWEYRIGGEEAEWLVYEVEATEGEEVDNSVISFILTLENYTSEWRARVVLIMPEVPVVEEPAVEEPAVEEPAAEEPAPVAEEPVVEEPAPAPVVEEPVVEEPVVEEPAPAVEEPVVEEPAEVPAA